jgi:hypothetical protein
MRSLLVLAAAASMAFALPAGADESSSRFLSSVPARSGERLEMRLDSGAGLRIVAWDRDTVKVESHESLSRCPDATLSLQRSPDGVRLESRYREDSGRNHSCSMLLTVHVPRKFDLEFQSAGGSLEITGVKGRFEGRTGGGEIRLEGVRGQAHLTTGGGEIEVTDSDLDGRLSTGGGNVRFSGVMGDVVGTSGSMRHDVRGHPRSQ